MADGPNKSDFSIPQSFLFWPFFDLFSNMMDQKNYPSQKSGSTVKRRPVKRRPVKRLPV